MPRQVSEPARAVAVRGRGNTGPRPGLATEGSWVVGIPGDALGRRHVEARECPGLMGRLAAFAMGEEEEQQQRSTLRQGDVDWIRFGGGGPRPGIHEGDVNDPVIATMGALSCLGQTLGRH
ncbi:hypothetical protein NL676_012981 [Syzygium grande]|nr:hypothetical protein NL676_012981 [Syzygium grande]